MVYDRKIKYLDYLENGDKVRNAGFVKIEAAGDHCNIQINVTGLYPTDTFTREVRIGNDSRETSLGNLDLVLGKGSLVLKKVPLNSLGEEKITYEELGHIRLNVAKNREIMCRWNERPAEIKQSVPKAMEASNSDVPYERDDLKAIYEKDAEYRKQKHREAEYREINCERTKNNESQCDESLYREMIDEMQENRSSIQEWSQDGSWARPDHKQPGMIGEDSPGRTGRNTEGTGQMPMGSRNGWGDSNTTEREGGEERERAEREGLERERAEREGLERERVEREGLERERTERNRVDGGKLDRQNIDGEAERENLEFKRIERENEESLRIEDEGVESEFFQQKSWGVNEGLNEERVIILNSGSRQNTAHSIDEELQKEFSETPGRQPVKENNNLLKQDYTQQEALNKERQEQPIRREQQPVRTEQQPVRAEQQPAKQKQQPQRQMQQPPRQKQQSQRQMQQPPRQILQPPRQMQQNGGGQGNSPAGNHLEDKDVYIKWMEPGQEKAGDGNNKKAESVKGNEKPGKLFEDKWKQLSHIYTHISPFQDERDYLSIGPNDFVILQKSFHKLVNNSFLLHGFYNYEHLILARVMKKGEEKFYVGVPGNFYEREKQVAIMFGFESFECKTEPAQSGDFGYYMIRVEI